jgi:hypothetical protein
MKPLTNAKTMPPPSARPALNRPPTAEERRRAQRVLLRIGVTVHVAGKPPMPGNTHTVSASGAMIILQEALPEGTKLTIENSKTGNKVEAKVALAGAGGIFYAVADFRECVFPAEHQLSSDRFDSEIKRPRESRGLFLFCRRECGVLFARVIGC